jgi:hypothetical protein
MIVGVAVGFLTLIVRVRVTSLYSEPAPDGLQDSNDVAWRLAVGFAFRNQIFERVLETFQILRGLFQQALRRQRE